MVRYTVHLTELMSVLRSLGGLPGGWERDTWSGIRKGLDSEWSELYY